MIKFCRAIYSSLLFKFILSERLSNSLWISNILLFLEFINTVSIVLYNFIELIILLYKFLVISFDRYKEYFIWSISFSKFSGVLLTFPYAKAIDNPWSICLWVNILRRVAKFKGCPLYFYCLLESRLFSRISIFSEISLLFKEFLKSTNDYIFDSLHIDYLLMMMDPDSKNIFYIFYIL